MTDSDLDLNDSASVDALLQESVAGFDVSRLHQEFEEQNGFLIVEDFAPKSLADSLAVGLPELRSEVHRNYVPRQKKGGSVSRQRLDRSAPAYGSIYDSASFRRFLEQITGESLEECPKDDPHGYALYWYQEGGDHIGWHYDTSFYRGRRFTVLLCLVGNESCQLECEHYRDDPSRETVRESYTVVPRMLIIFDGDALWHRVTPLQPGDSERVLLTLEFLTDPTMSPWRRLISNVKDAAAYFGFREVFFGARG